MCSLIYYFTFKDILGIIFVLYHIFMESFDAEDTVENLSMVTININSGQSMATFSYDTCITTLCGIYLSEWGG